MKFEPKTEEQINQMNLWPDGIYPFTVAKATEEVKKNGNDMIVLVLNVYNYDGHSKVINDYLLEIVPAKLKGFCECVGLLESYNIGQLLPDDIVGKSGSLKLITQHDKTGKFLPKNAVHSYMKNAPTASAQLSQLDDEVPF